MRKKGLWLACQSKGDTTGGRAHGPTAMLFYCCEQSDVGSFLITETQKSSHWNEKRRHCLGPWSLTQPGVQRALETAGRSSLKLAT